MCVYCVAGYSRKGLVGVQAASAGGLLVGALLNRHAPVATCLCGTNNICVTFIEKPLGVLATYCFAMYSYIAIWLMLLHTGSPTQHIWCIDAVQYW